MDAEYGRIPTVEQIEIIIRRMTRVAPRGDLVLADYSERELAIAIRDLMRDTAIDVVDAPKVTRLRL